MTPDPSRTAESSAAPPNLVRWEALADSTRQLFHDIRNQLNGMELQLVLAGELADDRQVASELSRARQSVAGLGQLLGRLRRHLTPPELSLIACSPTLLGEWLAGMGEPGACAPFPAPPDGATVHLDPAAFTEACATLLGEHRAANPDLPAPWMRGECVDDAWQLTLGPVGGPSATDLLAGQSDYGFQLPAALTALSAMGITVEWWQPMNFRLTLPLSPAANRH